MAGKDSTQIEIQIPLKRVWAALTDPTILPKALSGFVESVEVSQGDGSASAGSIWKLNFNPAIPHATSYLKERIESDPETHTLVTVLLEGDSIGVHYSSSKQTYKFSSGAGDTTVLDWEFEYEAIVDDPPVANTKEEAIRALKVIEAYLISNNELYVY